MTASGTSLTLMQSDPEYTTSPSRRLIDLSIQADGSFLLQSCGVNFNLGMLNGDPNLYYSGRWYYLYRKYEGSHSTLLF